MRAEIAFRLIDVDGVTNMRDLGGYLVSDNKVIRLGLIYRSAKLDNVSEAGKKPAEIFIMKQVSNGKKPK